MRTDVLRWTKRGAYAVVILLVAGILLAVLLTGSVAVRELRNAWFEDELATFEGAKVRGKILYVHPTLLFSLVGPGGVWCEIETERGTMRALLTLPMEFDFPEDASITTERMPEGIRLIVGQYGEPITVYRIRSRNGIPVVEPEDDGRKKEPQKIGLADR